MSAGHPHHDHHDGAHGSPDRAGHDHHGHDHAGGLRGLVASVFRPHSHDAADSVDEALLDDRAGTRALAVSLGGLATTALIQLLILLASGSVALLADTIHNAADALTALPLGLAFWLGRRPANRRFTYGYGRAEDLAGVLIVVTIAASSILTAVLAVDRLVSPRAVHHLGWVAVAGVVGFVGNEVVARYRIGVGRRIGSAALVADGHHARTDGLTSLAVVAGAIGVAAGWSGADPVFGLAITVGILAVVRRAGRDVSRRLMDAVPEDLVDHVTTVVAGTPGIEAVEVVRVRWIGHELHAEAEVTSDGTLTLADAHDIAEQARHRLLHEVRRLTSVTIHSSPVAGPGSDPHQLTAHHFARHRAGTAAS
jgi:cation diffusion facilitator family transporter